MPTFTYNLYYLCLGPASYVNNTTRCCYLLPILLPYCWNRFEWWSFGIFDVNTFVLSVEYVFSKANSKIFSDAKLSAYLRNSKPLGFASSFINLVSLIGVNAFALSDLWSVTPSFSPLSEILPLWTSSYGLGYSPIAVYPAGNGHGIAYEFHRYISYGVVHLPVERQKSWDYPALDCG